MTFDLQDRMLEAAFTRGLGAAAAVYLDPGADLAGAGAPVRVIIASRDDEGEATFATPGFKTQVSVLQVRVGELAAQGVTAPGLGSVFRISAPGHELDGALFEVDAEPMIRDAARKVWTCAVSPPDPTAG